VALALRIVVRGMVQGVGFRWWAVREASRLGLSGFVRNLADGSVELVASGSGEALDLFEDLCRSGPRGAMVSGIEVSRVADGTWDGFRVVHSRD
jgi:acylphosphatase